jgi:hypothetical protein
MPTIDHDPNEPPVDRTRGPWWWVWPIVALLWAGTAYSFGFDWRSIALGFITGGLLAVWAIDLTGNKVPDWWRSKPPGA